MFGVVLLSCLMGLSLAAPYTFDTGLNPHWEAFKSTYQNKYDSQEEEVMRRAVWEMNLDMIRTHNLEADLGKHTYTLGMNEYSDWTHTEFTNFMNGYQMSNETRKGSMFLAPSNVELPDTVDWRTKGYVTPIKNQEQCGSCWAFSATGSLEGQHFKATGDLVSLSEQNLVDCSTRQGNMGCNGGLMDQAFDYVKKNDGIDTEESYPYEAKDDQCRFKASDVGATLTGYVDIRSGDETALQQAVGTVGPVSVAIDASQRSFQSYHSGVYVEPKCSSRQLDHGVLVVGYGTEDGQDYWLVKNSWGKSWGMDGYIKMARNHKNMCGIGTQASYPLV